VISNLEREARKLTDSKSRAAEGYFWLGTAEGTQAVFEITIYNKLMPAKGHADRSFDYMEEAQKIDPSLKDPYLYLGLHAHLLGTRGFFSRVVLRLMGYKVSKKEGREWVEMAMHEGRFLREEAELGLALCYLREKRWTDALPLIEKANEKYPENSFLAMAIGRLKSQIGDHDGSVTMFKKILERIQSGDPSYLRLAVGEVHLRLARELLSTGKPKEAVEEAHQALASEDAYYPVKAGANLVVGKARDLLHEREEALAAYRAVLDTDSNTEDCTLAKKFLKTPFEGEGRESD
jgi:tetratricopeptide (TPR) repeat protein